MDFQVLGAVLGASECSWRPLGALLRPLGALLRPLEASWRPLESVLCLPEEVLEASGAGGQPGSGSRGGPGAEDTTVFDANRVVLGPGGRTTGGGNLTS